MALIDGTPADDALIGTPGFDTLLGFGGDDTIDARGGDDEVVAGAGDDVVEAGNGDDRVDGRSGDDSLYGGAGSDLLSGGTGNDVLFGGAGGDALFGGSGDDLLFGGADDDLIDGGNGNDRVDGGIGDDFLDGGSGSDRVDGGAGRDTLFHTAPRGAAQAEVDRYIGGQGIDTLSLTLTQGQWLDRATQRELALWLQHLQDASRTPLGEVTDGSGFTLRVDASTLQVSSVETLRLTVDGRDIDLGAPVARRMDLTATVTEGSDPKTLRDAGTWQFFDLNWDDTHTVSVMPVVGTALGGTLTARLTDSATGDGRGTVTWVYQLDSAMAETLGLGDGQSATEVFQISLSDGSGNSVADFITVTIEGVGAVRSVIDLSDLTPALGFVIQGDTSSDAAGRSVSIAGDVNGDGFVDLIVGAPYGKDGGAYAGEAYVVFGAVEDLGSVDATGRHVIDLSELSAARGFIIQGDGEHDRLGRSVSAAGDVNGDGFDDLIVGAPYGRDGGDWSGEAYVIFGTTGELGAVDAAGRRVVDLTSVGTAEGFVIQGNGTNDKAGFSVASAGDVNGDGLDDMIVGSPYGGGEYAGGVAYVVLGTTGGFGAMDASGRRVVDLTSLGTTQGFVMQGDRAIYSAGSSVASAGDVNGDGFDDLIVGEPYSSDGGTYAGKAYVVFGTAGESGAVDAAGRRAIDMTDLTIEQGFIIQGDSTYDRAGMSVASAGDVNGDGFGDLLVGAPEGDDAGYNAGEAYVVFGKAAGIGAVDSTGRQVVDLSTLGPAQGFLIQGDSFDDWTGFSASSAGDVNGDGFDDLIVGAFGGEDGGPNAGEAYVVFGSSGGFGSVADGRRVVDLTELTAAQGFVIQGDAEGDRAGMSVSSAGDINRDGFDDLIVGAPRGDDAGNAAGEAYVVFGAPFGASSTPITTTGTTGADILIGSLGNDSLTGAGGADVIRSGAGDDRITVRDGTCKRIDGSTGQDVLIFDFDGLTLDFTAPGGTGITGIETVDLTGRGDNLLVLDADDVFDFSDVPNTAFTAAGSHNSLVIDGDLGDSLWLELGGTTSGAAWQRVASDVGLDGGAGGAYDLFSLLDGDGVLASVAVGRDVGVFGAGLVL